MSHSGASNAANLNKQTWRRPIRRLRQAVLGYDVFISYHWTPETQKVVDAVRSQLEEIPLDCFVDRATIEYGDGIPGRIRNGIRKSRVFLVLITEETIRSKWVSQEIEMARRAKRSVVPVNVGTVLETYAETSRWIHGGPIWPNWDYLSNQKFLPLVSLQEEQATSLIAQTAAAGVGASTTRLRAARLLIAASLVIVAALWSVGAWGAKRASDALKLASAANGEKTQAITDRDTARQAKAEADRLKGEAVSGQMKAEGAKRIAVQAQLVAERAKQNADRDRAASQRARDRADAERTVAEKKRDEANQQMQEAVVAQDGAKASELSQVTGSEHLALKTALEGVERARKNHLPLSLESQRGLTAAVQSVEFASGFPASQGQVCGSALSPNGSRLAVEYFNDLWIVDVKSGRAVQKPIKLGDRAETLYWSGNGKYIAYTSVFSDVKIIDLATGYPIFHQGSFCKRTRLSYDGRTLLCFGEDGGLFIRKIGESQTNRLDVGTPIGCRIADADFSPDGESLALLEVGKDNSSQLSPQLTLYSLSGSKRVWSASVKENEGLNWNTGGKCIALWGHNEVRVVFPILHTIGQVAIKSRTWINSAAVSSEGCLALTTDSWGIQLLNQSIGSWQTRPVGEEPIDNVFFSDDGRWMYTVDRVGDLIATDLVTGQRKVPRSHGDGNSSEFCCASPDGNYVGMVSLGSILVWNVATGEIKQSKPSLKIWNAQDLAVTNEGQCLVVYEYGQCNQIDLTTGKEIPCVTVKATSKYEPIHSKILGNGKFVLSEYVLRNVIEIVDANNQKVIASYPKYDREFLEAATYFKGRFFLAFSDSYHSHLEIVNPVTGERWELPFVNDFQKGIGRAANRYWGLYSRGVSFTPRGDQLLFALPRGAIQVWDVRKKSLVNTVQLRRYLRKSYDDQQTEEYESVTVLPDGERIAVVGIDGQVRIYPIDTDGFVLLAHRLLFAPLKFGSDSP